MLIRGTVLRLCLGDEKRRRFVGGALGLEVLCFSDPWTGVRGASRRRGRLGRPACVA